MLRTFVKYNASILKYINGGPAVNSLFPFLIFKTALISSITLYRYQVTIFY